MTNRAGSIDVGSRALQVGLLALAVSEAQSAAHDVFTSTGSYLYLTPGMCSL